MAGKNRDQNAAANASPEEFNPQAPKPAVPTIADQESRTTSIAIWQNENKKSKSKDPRLTLPTTTIAGPPQSSDKKQEEEEQANEQVDEAVNKQADLLAEY